MTTKRKIMDTEDDFDDAEYLDPLGDVNVEVVPEKKIRLTSKESTKFSAEEKELIFGKLL